MSRVDELEAIIQQAAAELAQLRQEHSGCQDGWYACPKSEDYIWHECEGDDQREHCTCGADRHNAHLDALLARMERVLESGKEVASDSRLRQKAADLLPDEWRRLHEQEWPEEGESAP